MPSNTSQNQYEVILPHATLQEGYETSTSRSHNGDSHTAFLEKKPPKWCCMRGVSSSHPRSLRIRKLLYAIFNVANAALGAGILGFPFAFKLSGWGVGLLMTLFSGLLSGYTLTTILRCARLHNVTDFQAIIAKMFGEKAAKRLLLAIGLFCFFSNVSYLIIMGSMAISFFSEWFAADSIGTNMYFLTSVAWVLILPLQFFKDIEFLGPFAAIGVIAVFFVVGMLIYRCATAESTGPDLQLVNMKPVAFQALPIIMFGMFCHLTVTPACMGLGEYWPSLNRPKKTRFRTLVITAVGTMILCSMLYVPAAMSGYFLFGDTVVPDVLDSFGVDGSKVFVTSTFDVKFSRICMLITTALGYPTTLFVGRLSIFDAIRPNGVKHMSCMYVSVTLAFTFSSLLFALLTRLGGLDLDFLLSLTSCTVGVLIQFIYPALMLVKLGDKCKGYCLLSFGIIVSAIGLFICITGAVCGKVNGSFCDIMGM